MMKNWKKVVQYGFIGYCTIYSLNYLKPQDKLADFYSRGFSLLLGEFLSSPEIKGSGLDLLVRIFKKQSLIDIQLNQLKLAVKSNNFIEQSKPFGKIWIISVVKESLFVDFTKIYFLDLSKQDEVKDSSANLLKYAIKDAEVVSNWATLVKKSVLDYKETFDAMISTLSKTGLKGLTDENNKSEFTSCGISIITNKDVLSKFLREISPI